MKTAHRNAARAKREQLPAFWRTCISASRQTTLSILHWDALTRISLGSATVETMWEWIAGALTFERMAQILAEQGAPITPEAQAALAEQTLAAHALRRRHAATGRVVFTGPELLAARAAAHLTEDLLASDRHGASTDAALWSEQQLAALQAEHLTLTSTLKENHVR